MLSTLATLLAETSRRRVAAFMPDSAIVEMLVMTLSCELVGQMVEQPPNAFADKQALLSAAQFER